MNDAKPRVTVRTGTEADLSSLLVLDHGYSTEYVWQMEMEQGVPKMGAKFREARLPRTKEQLEKELKQRSVILVAESAGQPVGYAGLSLGVAPGAAWLTDLVVGASQRRKGIGSRLALAAQTWARDSKQERLVMEMQSKNHPAIRLAQKLAFEFAGYNDRYYENQDIALFFAKKLV
jgi:ribosomal protein S18 acetylase RimI-like enzyme